MCMHHTVFCRKLTDTCHGKVFPFCGMQQQTPHLKHAEHSTPGTHQQTSHVKHAEHSTPVTVFAAHGTHMHAAPKTTLDHDPSETQQSD